MIIHRINSSIRCLPILLFKYNCTFSIHLRLKRSTSLGRFNFCSFFRFLLGVFKIVSFIHSIIGRLLIKCNVFWNLVHGRGLNAIQFTDLKIIAVVPSQSPPNSTVDFSHEFWLRVLYSVNYQFLIIAWKVVILELNGDSDRNQQER